MQREMGSGKTLAYLLRIVLCLASSTNNDGTLPPEEAWGRLVRTASPG